MRAQRGMKVPTMSYHLVFTGNPGTGKTTVARLVAKLYYHMGILPQGQLVETDRSALVAGYLGQTAIKTQKVIQQAISPHFLLVGFLFCGRVCYVIVVTSFALHTAKSGGSYQILRKPEIRS